MGKVTRIAQRLWGLTTPHREKPPVIAISDSHAHFCENCRCFVKITLWSMETCPACGSDQIKFAAAWMRTPGEQAARAETRKRPRFIKALNGGVPKSLPQRVVTVTTPKDAA